MHLDVSKDGKLIEVYHCLLLFDVQWKSVNLILIWHKIYVTGLCNKLYKYPKVFTCM